MPPLKRRASRSTAAALFTTAVLLASGALVATSSAPAAVRSSPQDVAARAAFADTIAHLSEPGGFFDSNNLVSNERSYLHVIPAVRAAGLDGGAYLGVGPDQNFSYIAHTRPSIAFIVDIRRDNMLLHLLFKALFEMSDSRAEYLSMLCGRPAPKPERKWKHSEIARIAAYIDSVVSKPEAIARLRSRIDGVIVKFGVPLSQEDFATIDRFHRAFIDNGLSLRFESAGRPPRSFYPMYRDLLLETDRNGRRWNYLASEPDFQFVRSLQERDLIIPVVCDLAGPTALRGVGRVLKERGSRLSAFYTSNVEYYLASRGVFQQFVANVAELPHDGRSVIIRAIFPNRFGWIPATPGYNSASLVQPVDDLLAGVASGRIRDYGDVAASAR